MIMPDQMITWPDCSFLNYKDIILFDSVNLQAMIKLHQDLILYI